MTVDAAPSLVPARRWPARRIAVWTGGLAIAGLAYYGAYVDTGFSFTALGSGFHGMVDIIRRSQPPAGSVLSDSIRAALITISTAFLGTTIALVFSLPLTPLAARNIAPNRIVYETTRFVMGILRSIPDLIFALIFVAAVGLGPFAGVLALGVHSIGTMGKLQAEAIEDMDMGPVDALRVSGAGRLQVFLHGVLPGVAPQFVGLLLYRLDNNVRSSLLLGFVGAGGLGFLIENSVQLFQYDQVTTEIVVMLALILIVERLSTLLRRRIV